MDLDSFLRNCHEKINLQSDFVLNQFDPSTVSYIQPFCLNDTEKPLIGFIYVCIIFIFFNF